MSSEPTRASLLRALFKMEPAASEVLGGASEFVKGESEPGALPVPRSRGLCCGASLGSLFFPPTALRAWLPPSALSALRFS